MGDAGGKDLKWVEARSSCVAEPPWIPGRLRNQTVSFLHAHLCFKRPVFSETARNDKFGGEFTEIGGDG